MSDATKSFRLQLYHPWFAPSPAHGAPSLVAPLAVVGGQIPAAAVAEVLHDDVVVVAEVLSAEVLGDVEMAE